MSAGQIIEENLDCLCQILHQIVIIRINLFLQIFWKLSTRSVPGCCSADICWRTIVAQPNSQCRSLSLTLERLTSRYKTGKGKISIHKNLPCSGLFWALGWATTVRWSRINSDIPILEYQRIVVYLSVVVGCELCRSPGKACVLFWHYQTQTCQHLILIWLISQQS